MKDEKQQLWIILLIVFIGFIGTSIAYPIFPPLFLHPAAHTIVPLSWNENIRSIVLGLALAAYPFGQFIGSPILGSCSDHYSRKSILTISLLGGVLGYFLSAISLQFNWLWILILSRFLTGMAEGNLAIVRAMATDLTSINKYKSLGRINSVSSIGYIMGPLIGGFLSDDHLVSWFSYSLPFYLAAFFAFTAVILAALKLNESTQVSSSANISILQRINLIARFKLIFESNINLKYLLMISTIFTFSVDIFYEFGAVYLTGLWSSTPAQIAIYNVALCITLALGSGWLPHYLSRYFAISQVTITMMLITAALLAAMALYLSPIFAFILFSLLGFSIAVATTNTTIQISNEADKLIQGEAMGAQLSLRMLGDSIICVIGGFLIISSVILPIACSGLVALIAAALYRVKIMNRKGDLPKKNIDFLGTGR